MHPDLYALVLRFQPVMGELSAGIGGHHAHALFLDVVRQVDAPLAARLHEDAPSKPFTVAILPRRRSDPLLDLRVTLTDAAIFQPFVRALLQGVAARVRLGTATLILQEVFGTPQGHPWAGFTAFTELQAAARPAAHIALEFAGATVFGRGTRADGRVRLGLLPLPETVFKSLAKRWNELSPTFPLDLDALEKNAREDVLLTHYQLRSTQISLGKGPQKGFTGMCVYELPTDPQQRRLYCMLADAAFYLGIGMKTARGMGLCRRITLTTDIEAEEAL